MSTLSSCPTHYQLVKGICFHYLWPPTFGMLIGSLILGFTNSLATLAGLGGGSIALVVLMSFFEYLPKDASLVVFSCVLGTASGNTFNLVFKALNGKPIIQYHFSFVSIPIIFTGSFIGFLMNKFFPSAITYSIIIIVFLYSLKKTYTRFITQYQRQTEQNLLKGNQIEDIHQQTTIQPFKNGRNMFIFKNLGILMLITIVLSFIRGSSKFPSVIGVTPCSGLYWLIFISSFTITLLYAYRNIQILKSWYASGEVISNQLNSKQQNLTQFDNHIKEMLIKSTCAGIFSGFGLGGGIFLVPMYRHLGCTPLQATATCAFGIFITSFINCIQAVSMGAIRVSQFLYFVIFLGVVGYTVSKIISTQLRKRNRFSLVQGILLVITIVATINIPISLYNRYVDNGYNPKIIFGFGHLC